MSIDFTFHIYNNVAVNSLGSGKRQFVQVEVIIV